MAVLLWPLFQTNQKILTLMSPNSTLTAFSTDLNLINPTDFQSVRSLQTANSKTEVLVTGGDITNNTLFLVPIPNHSKVSQSFSLKLEPQAENTLPSIFWLHFISCIMILAFTAISPYVYVFRSKKVKNCLKDILKDRLFCNYCRPGLSEQLNSPSLASKLSVNNVAANEKEKMCVQALNNHPKPKSNKVVRQFKNGNAIPSDGKFNIKNNNNLEAKTIKISASQNDLISTHSPSNNEKYHIRCTKKNVGGQLPKTFSCPDVLKFPTKVCLESSL